ncbi:MAG TPA: hypothetical protein VHU80_09610 [Polyangiaceae bacterium]|nr:hypothetical protein [Polyangiaceae bacterium]
MDSGWLALVILAPLLALGVYWRLRRTLGRQRYAPRRMRARIIVLSAVGVALLASLPTLPALGASAAGAALGSGLAVFGLRHTRWERTDEGLFFTPNRWIGLGVTGLFLGRLVVRLLTAYRLAQEAALSGEPLGGIHRSAFTLTFYFLLAGYYGGYYALVLKHAPASAKS